MIVQRPKSPDPTLAEISAACAEIQAGWTEAEEFSRRYGSPIEGFYHLAAEILGADPKVAHRLFRADRSERDNGSTVKTVKTPPLSGGIDEE